MAETGEQIPLMGSALPCISGSAYVVYDLTVVNADVLVENDVSGSGSLHLQYNDAWKLTHVNFDGDLHADINVAAAAQSLETNLDGYLSPHVKVTRDDEDITLKTDHGGVHWKSVDHKYVLSWMWKNSTPPAGTIGSGIGESSRFTPKTEMFAAEVEKQTDGLTKSG